MANWELHITARQLGIRTDEKSPQIEKNLYGEIESLLATGGADTLSPAKWERQDFQPNLGTSRKITMVPNTNPENDYIVGGIGNVTKTDYIVTIYPPDPNRTIRSVATNLPSHIMQSHKVLPTGEIVHTESTEPLGGYMALNAEQKYRNTQHAARLFANNPVTKDLITVCEPIAHGTYTTLSRDGSPLGFFISSLPTSTVSINTLLKADYTVFEYMKLETGTPQAIESFIRQSRYLQAVGILFTAQRILHEHDVVHRQLHGNNVFVQKRKSHIMDPEKLWITDWSTMMDISKYQGRVEQKDTVVHPRALAKSKDFEVALWVYTGADLTVDNYFSRIMYYAALERAVFSYLDIPIQEKPINNKVITDTAFLSHLKWNRTSLVRQVYDELVKQNT